MSTLVFLSSVVKYVERERKHFLDGGERFFMVIAAAVARIIHGMTRKRPSFPPRGGVVS